MKEHSTSMGHSDSSRVDVRRPSILLLLFFLGTAVWIALSLKQNVREIFPSRLYLNALNNKEVKKQRPGWNFENIVVETDRRRIQRDQEVDNVNNPTDVEEPRSDVAAGAKTMIPTMAPTLKPKEQAKAVDFSKNYWCELECNLSRLFLARSSPCLCFTASDLTDPPTTTMSPRKTIAPNATITTTLEPISAPTLNPTKFVNLIPNKESTMRSTDVPTESPTITYGPTITPLPTITGFPTITSSPSETPDNVTISSSQQQQPGQGQSDDHDAKMGAEDNALLATSLTVLKPGALHVLLDLRHIPNITAVVNDDNDKSNSSTVEPIDTETKVDGAANSEKLGTRKVRGLRGDATTTTTTRKKQAVYNRSLERLLRLLLVVPIGNVRIVGSDRPLNFVRTTHLTMGKKMFLVFQNQFCS
jgi:hypothetical protein